MCMQAIMEKKLTGEQLIPLPRTLLISCGYFLLCILTMLLFEKPAVFRYAIALCMVPFCLKYFLPQLKLILKTLKSDRKHSKK